MKYRGQTLERVKIDLAKIFVEGTYILCQYNCIPHLYETNNI